MYSIAYAFDEEPARILAVDGVPGSAEPPDLERMMRTPPLIISSAEPQTIPEIADEARARLRRQFSMLAMVLLAAVLLAWAPFFVLPAEVADSIRFLWVFLFYWILSWLAGGIGIVWIFRTARGIPSLERETRVQLDTDTRDKLIEALRSLSARPRS